MCSLQCLVDVWNFLPRESHAVAIRHSLCPLTLPLCCCFYSASQIYFYLKVPVVLTCINAE